MRWNDLSQFFEVDGSLRDIIVRETSVSDWDKLISLAFQLGEVSYQRDGEEAVLPPSAAVLLDDKEHAHCMKVDLGGPVANAHFFSSDEVELDIDPREIRSQPDLDLVLNFCASIGRKIERDVRITPENAPDVVYLLYSVKQKAWQSPMRQ